MSTEAPIRLFLSGPMGSGKSSVGRAAAAVLGVPFVDLDAQIAIEQGASVRRIFEERGEAEFRRIERETIRRMADRPGPVVIALGGGTVVDWATRRYLLQRGVVVTLRAPVAELIRRLEGARDRPLLVRGDPVPVLTALIEERASAYAECHGVIDTAGRTIESIAREAIAIACERPVVVPLGERTYRVEIGAGIGTRVGDRLRQAGVAGVVVVVSDSHVEQPWAARCREHVAAAGYDAASVTLPPGEAMKTIRSVEAIWDAALAAGIDRQGAVVAVGGGVVGDLAGFAASTLLRGVALGQLPTTLLAMVDASVGGKTGFNHAKGKNLLGTFHHPRFVLCDVDALSTLEPAERIAGLAEIAKAAWLDGEETVAALEHDAAALRSGDRAAMIAAIRRAVALKARIVADDEREDEGRALLNLGHTLGHAMEAASGWQMRHGEAVARGMIVAIRVAQRIGYASDAEVARLERLLAALGLPTDPDRYLGPATFAFVDADKKRRGREVRFVLPGAPGHTRIHPIALTELERLVLGGA
jgi:shikimate kinase/3-dehydroquinate synthase